MINNSFESKLHLAYITIMGTSVITTSTP